MTKPIVPRHEPEVVNSGAKRYFGDDDKVPTTSVKSLIVHGVKLESRYDKARELEKMAAMVENVHVQLRHVLVSIFCDSKAGACYSVQFRGCDMAVAKKVAVQLEEASGGHNGIYAKLPDFPDFDLSPNWPGDWVTE